MADRRLIATDITDSGQVEQLVRALGGREGFWAATFFSWLIPFLDDDGRVIGKPAALRAKILARYGDLVTEDEVAEALAVMNDIDLLVWYEVVGSPGERYLYSPRFAVHQTLRTDRYGPSRHPSPPAWQPDEGHPYEKNPELRKAKPQRDSRRTARVPRRSVNKGGSAVLATTWQPVGDQPETTLRPGSSPAGTEDSSPLASSPLLTSRLPTAEPARSALGASELRSDARGGRPACERDGCGHPWFAHRGPGDPAFHGERTCAVKDCTCAEYVTRDEDPFSDVVSGRTAR